MPKCCVVEQTNHLIFKAYSCEFTAKNSVISIKLLHNEKYLKLNKYKYNATVNSILLIYEMHLSYYEMKLEWESWMMH